MGDGITHSRPKAHYSRVGEIERLEFDEKFVDYLIDGLCRLHGQINEAEHYKGNSRIEESMDIINETLKQYLQPYYVIRGE